jgi:hypothetical protein
LQRPAAWPRCPLGEELRREIKEDEKRRAALAALVKAGRGAGDSDHDAAYDAWNEGADRCLALVNEIEARPATTLRGFAAKGRALLYGAILCELSAGDERYIDPAESRIREFLSEIRSAAGLSS